MSCGGYQEINLVRVAQAKADELGLNLVAPNSDELFVDLDSHEAIKIFFSRLNDVMKTVGLVSVMSNSASGLEGHKHAYVKLDRPVKSDYERIFLQLFLGSDPSREWFNWMRLGMNDPNPVVFFEKKDFVRPEYPVITEQKMVRQVRFDDEEQ